MLVSLPVKLSTNFPAVVESGKIPFSLRILFNGPKLNGPVSFAPFCMVVEILSLDKKSLVINNSFALAKCAKYS